jgi:hypothetical protein
MILKIKIQKNDETYILDDLKENPDSFDFQKSLNSAIEDIMELEVVVDDSTTNSIKNDFKNYITNLLNNI